jgi:hypothetical protein
MVAAAEVLKTPESPIIPGKNRQKAQESGKIEFIGQLREVDVRARVLLHVCNLEIGFSVH